MPLIEVCGPRPRVQWGLEVKIWSEPSTTSILCVYQQAAEPLLLIDAIDIEISCTGPYIVGSYWMTLPTVTKTDVFVERREKDHNFKVWEHSGRVLDLRPRGRGSSLTGVTALWSLSKTHLS